MTKKNGKIEFYRFLFCIYVLLFHAQKEFIGEPEYTNASLGLFPHGSIGVEFFFIVSGFFLARSAFSRRKVLGNEPLCSRAGSADTIRFMLRKYLRIFPEHMVAFLLITVLHLVCTRMRPGATVLFLLRSVFSFFLVQMSGLLQQNVFPIEWYLSCMLIAMAVLYPLCRRFYYGFTRVAAPLASLMIYGWLCHETAALTNVLTWMGIGYKSLFRAFAGLMLGAAAFEAARILSARKLSRGARRLLHSAEILSFVFTTLFALTRLPKIYEYQAAFALFLLVVCVGSEAYKSAAFFDSRLVSRLGALSFAVYLSQGAAINLVHHFWKAAAVNTQIMIYLVLCLAFTLFIHAAGGWLDRKVFRRISEAAA